MFEVIRDSFHKHNITHIDCVTIIIYNILTTISTLKTTNAFIQFEYFYITKNKYESTLQIEWYKEDLQEDD